MKVPALSGLSRWWWIGTFVALALALACVALLQPTDRGVAVGLLTGLSANCFAIAFGVWAVDRFARQQRRADWMPAVVGAVHQARLHLAILAAEALIALRGDGTAQAMGACNHEAGRMLSLLAEELDELGRLPSDDPRLEALGFRWVLSSVFNFSALVPALEYAGQLYLQADAKPRVTSSVLDLARVLKASLAEAPAVIQLTKKTTPWDIGIRAGLFRQASDLYKLLDREVKHSADQPIDDIKPA
ncbi:MAG: hypothetical protein HY825_00515 [Acidobacteria bacterium]|nr:hypothetical protein [Acidobacteriota bacterium]